MQPEVSLKVRYRPLRFVYLVDSELDLNKATTLYTHVWGGAYSAIFSYPKDSNQTAKLQRAMHSFNPDYVFLPEEDVQHINEVLESVPSCFMHLSTEEIEKIANLDGHGNYLRTSTLSSFNSLELPHIIRILNATYPTPLNSGNFCVSTDNSSFETIRSLQFGKPSERYKGHLKHHLGASSLHIDSLENLLKVSLLEAVGAFESPISLTKKKILSLDSSDHGEVRQSNMKVCNLFLYEAGEVSIAARFWNSRSSEFSYSNKFLLPKNHFLEDFNATISLLSTFLPFVNELIIYVNVSKDHAETLASSIDRVFKELGRKVFIEIRYRGHRFAAYPNRAYSSNVIQMTRQILSSQSICFSPIAPAEYENSNCVFGYDASVEFASGASLEMPLSYESSVLLSNKAENIEYYESSKSLSVGGRLQPVRADKKGISGVAVDSKECQIYVPTSEEVISRWLRKAGYSLRSTNHTRYAQGFIRRFGGFIETKRLVNSGGTKIFIALNSKGAQKSGFKKSQIDGFLKDRFLLNKSELRKVVEQNLPKLLAKELVYRGCSLECPICRLNAWYKLDKVDEFVECVGCAEDFQLDKLTTIEFSYRPNELAARFLGSDGPAILSAAAFLSRIVSYKNIHMGGELLRSGEKNPIAEVDLFVFSKDHMMLVECKSQAMIDQDGVDKIIVHLKRVVETAILLEARVVLLCIVTAKFDDVLLSSVHDVAKDSAEKGIGVHLLLNDELYGFGSEDQKISKLDTYSLKIEALLPQEEDEVCDSSIQTGEQSKVYNFGEGEALDLGLINQWKQELKTS